MAPTINWRKRTRHSKGYNLRKQPTPVPSGIRQIKQARQAEAKIVRKKQPASTARYSVLNNQQTMVPKEAPKEAPKLVFDRDAVTVRNQKSSPFLRLPPELRNKIYRLVGQKVTLGRRAQDFNLYSQTDLSLLLTSRQVNHEASSLLPDHQILRLEWGYLGVDLRDLYLKDRKRAKLSIWNVSELEIHFTFFGIYGFMQDFNVRRYLKHRQADPDLLTVFPRLQHIEAFGTQGKNLPAIGLAWLKDLCCGDHSELQVRIT